MKRLVLALMLVLLPLTALAGEKDELQWKARALIAEANLASARLGEAQKAINDFIKEIDVKGYTIKEDGSVAEKEKPKAPQSPSTTPPQVAPPPKPPK